VSDAIGRTYVAPASALGYLAQVEYALLLALRRMDDEEDFGVSIEFIDDIVFHAQDGTPLEVLQSKHHVSKQGSLNNASSDIWNTLRNWILDPAVEDAALIIVATTTANPGSAAFYLKDTTERNPGRALAALERTANESTNQDNAPYYQAFRKLSRDQRHALIDRITVLDGATRVDELSDAMERAVRKSAHRDRRLALIERLRGWWHGRVIEHLTRLAEGQSDYISVLEIEDRLLAISSSLQSDNLPIDFQEMLKPLLEDITSDDRIFVEQLRIIALSSQRLRNCIHDHNRAYKQRSEWLREHLLNPGELLAYDSRLLEEWERYFLPLTDDSVRPSDEEGVKSSARDMFAKLDTSQLPAIRRRVPQCYVANGSLHILADNLRIGWHPQWEARFEDKIRALKQEEGHIVA